MIDTPPLNEETVGQQPKKAAVVVGRFNPPTIGHYALFRSVKKWMKAHADLNLYPLPIVVIIEGKNTSKDKGRNPLEAKDRIAAMLGSKKADGIKFLIAGSAFEAFEAVRKAGFEPTAVAVGTDRADSKYVDMLDKYFKTPKGDPIKHYEIHLERDSGTSNFGGLDDLDKEQALSDVLKYVDKDISPNMVSGSLARHAVEKGEFEKFQALIGIEDKTAAKVVFDKVKRSLDADKSEKAEAEKAKAAKKEKTDGAA